MIQPEERTHELLKAVRMLTLLRILSLVLMIFLLLAFLYDDAFIKFARSIHLGKKFFAPVAEIRPGDIYWSAPDLNKVIDVELKAQIAYGKELIAHTARYLGPKG